MRTLPLAVVLPLLLASCAWSRRDNRPLWNAFEANCVPESGGAFVAALPLTVPLGLGAILADTLVVHPLQVVDDAADDAADLWRGLDWQQEYYTQCGFAPVRAVATPCWFLLSFVGRSMFDVASTEQREADRAAWAARRRAETLVWLERLARGEVTNAPPALPAQFDPELRAAVAAAAAQATALGRIRLYAAAARQEALGAGVDWAAALQDESAVVRFFVVRELPREVAVPDALLARLREDPDEAVRTLARRPREQW